MLARKNAKERLKTNKMHRKSEILKISAPQRVENVSGAQYGVKVLWNLVKILYFCKLKNVTTVCCGDESEPRRRR